MKGPVTLIVPCYNEEESLPIFYHAVCDVAQTLPDYQMTFLLINDGSKDNTLQIMRDAMDAGAAGPVFGRQIWQDEHIVAMTRAIVAIVHGDASVDEAMEVYRQNQ